MRTAWARPAIAGMRFLIDENLSRARLAQRRRAQRHDPALAGDVGLCSLADAGSDRLDHARHSGFDFGIRRASKTSMT